MRGGMGVWAVCALLVAGCASVHGISQELANFLNNGTAAAPSPAPSASPPPLGNVTNPSFILFSLDGALMEASWEAGYNNFISLVEMRNPNGCRIPMTWFASKQGRGQGKCEVAQRMREYGHELATHSVMHDPEVLNYTYAEMKADIGGMKDWLVNECGIPTEEVLGYRAPYFKVNDFTGQALSELGFLYDSSLPDKDHTQRAGRWDQGMELVCNRDYRECSTWPQYPLWEIPVWRLPGDDKRTDPAPSEGLSVYQRLEQDFNRKRDLGVPVSIATHENYVTATPAAVQEMVDFVDWALSQPNTWVTTYQQYLRWVQDPEASMEDIMSEYKCDETS